MKKKVCFLVAAALLGCLSGVNAYEVNGTNYTYSAPVMLNSANYNMANSVQLYSADTPDANRTKAIRENSELPVEVNVSQLPTLDNLPPNTIPQAQYVVPDMLYKIDSLDTKLYEMNKNLLTEIKKINERFDVLNAQVQKNNIKEVNKQTVECTLPLSKAIQKAFAEN